MSKTRTLSVIMKNRTNPAYRGALSGVMRIAERHGWVVRPAAPVTPDDISEQAELVRAAVAERPDAMILLPAQESRLKDVIASITAADIALFHIVSRPQGTAYVTFVGSDNRALAENTASNLFDAIGDTGRVAIIDGHPDSITTPERHAAFLAVADERPQIEIVEAVSGYYQREPAFAATRELLARHTRLDGIIVANDLMALGVIDALEAAERKFPVVSINGTPEAIAAVKAGRLLATASFDTLSFGALAAESVVRHADGEAVPREIILATQIIDQGNCDAWNKPYETRATVPWDVAVG